MVAVNQLKLKKKAWALVHKSESGWNLLIDDDHHFFKLPQIKDSGTRNPLSKPILSCRDLGVHHWLFSSDPSPEYLMPILTSSNWVRTYHTPGCKVDERHLEDEKVLVRQYRKDTWPINSPSLHSTTSHWCLVHPDLQGLLRNRKKGVAQKRVDAMMTWCIDCGSMYHSWSDSVYLPHPPLSVPRSNNPLVASLPVDMDPRQARRTLQKVGQQPSVPKDQGETRNPSGNPRLLNLAGSRDGEDLRPLPDNQRKWDYLLPPSDSYVRLHSNRWQEKTDGIQVTKKIYDVWLPTLFKRISSVIYELPPDIDFEFSQDSELGESGLSQGLESQHIYDKSRQSSRAPSHNISPETSSSQNIERRPLRSQGKGKDL